MKVFNMKANNCIFPFTWVKVQKIEKSEKLAGVRGRLGPNGVQPGGQSPPDEN